MLERGFDMADDAGRRKKEEGRIVCKQGEFIFLEAGTAISRWQVADVRWQVQQRLPEPLHYEVGETTGFCFYIALSHISQKA
ncbi:hypothetical protein HJFPF1_07997 [Paramyrothecium foliicola]|nr:hypothetical protein HJFPF1_07997 [Paramyrothecium foliicola]